MPENAGKPPLVNPRLIQLGEVFTPDVPIYDADLFSGRSSLLLRIADAVSQRGMHCILFGERGVGKTSLTNILPDHLSAIGAEVVTAGINCDTTDDYSSLMHKLMQEIIITQQTRKAGFVNGFTVESNPLSHNLPDAVRPNDVRLLFQAIDANSLLILDEFDRITDQDTVRLMSDTIKTLSDRAVPATIMLVGVSDNVDGLLREHRSIERCLAQVRMPRMTTEELTEIIDTGLNQVDMTMDDSARWYIPAVAQGYPHYAHLLALAAARCTVRDGRNCVIRDDIDAAIDDALDNTEHSIRDSYLKAVYSPNSAALYVPVLLACALADSDDLNYFNAQAVRGSLSQIMGKTYDIPSFARHLDAFCGLERGAVLIKEGRRRNYRYRFSVPLLRPYVLLQGIASRRISADVLR